MADPVEEGGKAVNVTIDALRAQPITLAMVIFNSIFVAAVYYGIHDQRIMQNEQDKKLIELIARQSDLLARCIVPEHTAP
jgi:hypothetical protein